MICDLLGNRRAWLTREPLDRSAAELDYGLYDWTAISRNLDKI